MDNITPYYALLTMILVFIFLWFFFGGEEYEFVGLRPLLNEEVSYYEEEQIVCKNNISNVTTYNNIDPTNIDDVPITYNKDVTVDLTPKLPDAFIEKVCLNVPKNNKFVSKGEKICKDTLERIYGVPFENTRPNWLKNPETKRNLELDCYNENLRIGVEYSGEAHFKWSAYAKQTYSDFREQVRRDRLKKELCAKNNVHLIVVPYNVPHNLIPTYIVYHLPEIVRKRVSDDKIEI
jgi:hypothetical protein